MSEQQQTTQRTWTEAPASATVKARYAGREWMLTVRDDSVSGLIGKVETFSAWLDKHAENAINIEAPAVTTTSPAPQQPAITTQTNGALTFEVERMEANVNAGKVSWRCKGGHFTQYGVICWPEVIKAANLELDPAKGAYTFNPPMIAEYALKDDGKPQKVTRLYQKAQA